MKTSLSVILLMVFASLAFGQTKTELETRIKTFRQSRSYAVKYDKSKDTTTVYYRASDIYNRQGVMNRIPVKLGVNLTLKDRMPKTAIRHMNCNF
jgi:hypothetical protein